MPEKPSARAVIIQIFFAGPAASAVVGARDDAFRRVSSRRAARRAPAATPAKGIVSKARPRAFTFAMLSGVGADVGLPGPLWACFAKVSKGIGDR